MHIDIEEAISTNDLESVLKLAVQVNSAGSTLSRGPLLSLLSDCEPGLPSYVEAVLALIEVTPELKSGPGEISLFERALQTSHIAIVRAFVMRGINVKGRKTLLDSFLALYEPASEQIALIDYLINKGINAEPGTLGNTLLELLANSGPLTGDHEVDAVQLVSHLLEVGADANYREARGEQHSVLFAAVNTESLDLVRLLIERGADPNVQTKRGFTPLMIACGEVYRPSDGGVISEPSASKNLIVKYLVETGADRTIIANGKRTALSIAKTNDNWDAVEILAPASRRAKPKKRLIDRETIDIIEFLHVHESAATLHMQTSDGAWPTDKGWRKDRQELWKYFVQPSIKKLFMGNIRAKSYPMLRRYYVEGTASMDQNISSLLEAWLHADGSEKNMSRVLDKHNNFRSCSYDYIHQGGRLKAPYGVMGPRAKTLVKPIIRRCYPEEADIEYARRFDRDTNEIRIKGAYFFVGAFFTHAPQVFGPYESDPFPWPRYAIDELEHYLGICIENERDSYGIDATQVGRFYEQVSEYDPSALPDYKREYVPEFFARLQSIVESSDVSSFLNRASATRQ